MFGGATAGVYGDEDCVAQITVDAKGRVTSASNINIRPATGVTAGVYGNATTVPRITVGADGRVTSIEEESSAQYIQSVSWNSATNELSLSGGGNTIDLSSLNQQAFRIISAPGESDILADGIDDRLNFVGGAGIDVTLNSVTDTITITATGDAPAVDPATAVFQDWRCRHYWC